MGIFDNFQKDNNRPTGNRISLDPVRRVSSQRPTSRRGSIFSGISAPEPKKNLVSVAKDVGSSFIDLFNNPSEAQRSYESQFLPRASTPFVKTITDPGVTVARGISRLINPGLQPLATDIAEIHEVGRRGGIADRVSSGELHPDILRDFSTLKKKNTQIVGDVAQAVLTAYAGGQISTLGSKGAQVGFREAFKRGALDQAAVGSLFGASVVASEDMKDIKEIATTMGVSIGVASLLGGMLSGAVPASKIVRDSIRKSVGRNVVTRKLSVSSLSEGGQVAVRTPKQRYENYLRESGYQANLGKDADLPVIDFGQKAKDTGPVIDFETGLPRKKTPEVPKDDATIGSFADTIVNEGPNSKVVRDSVGTPQEPVVTKEPVLEVAPRVFESQTNKQQVETLRKKSLEDIEDIAMGRKVSKDNIPATAHLAELKNRATEQAAKGDMSLTNRLKHSDVGSLSGQDLQANKIAQSDNIVDMVRNIEKKINEKLPKARQKTRDKAIADTMKTMKKAFEDFKQKPTRRLIKDVLDVITCK